MITMINFESKAIDRLRVTGCEAERQILLKSKTPYRATRTHNRVAGTVACPTFDR